MCVSVWVQVTGSYMACLNQLVSGGAVQVGTWEGACVSPGACVLAGARVLAGLLAATLACLGQLVHGGAAEVGAWGGARVLALGVDSWLVLWHAPISLKMNTPSSKGLGEQGV